MTLKLRIGKKGYVIIPKAIRKAIGVDEGDDLIVTVEDGIRLTPERKIDRNSLHKAIARHKAAVFAMGKAKAPRVGEARKHSLEDEFD